MNPKSTERHKKFECDTLDWLRNRLSVEERLKGLSAAERLKGLPVEERLKGISADELVKGLPPETLEALTRQLKANGSSAGSH